MTSAVVCACSAVIQKEDDEGKVGVKIGKELMKVAGMALKVNITRLGPKVLPISEQLIFAANFVLRKVPPPSHVSEHSCSSASIQDLASASMPHVNYHLHAVQTSLHFFEPPRPEASALLPPCELL